MHGVMVLKDAESRDVQGENRVQKLERDWGDGPEGKSVRWSSKKT